MGEFTMPSLGADMDSGTLTRWLVKPGDAVRRGDIVAVVDTDKSTIEVEIFESGVIADLVVGEGENVPVGTVLAHVGSPSVPAALPAPEVTAPATGNGHGGVPAATGVVRPPVIPSPVVPSPVVPSPVVPPAVTHSPVVRRLADRLGVDLTAVVGSGRGGEVTRADVTQAAERLTEHLRAGPARRVRSSPLARRLAAEAGIDVATVAGSGP
ncbi:MAG TPA: E3 binding domain-containing protein, partial [Acidimicrobiales bacterium]|nr:E3 binding domain-containing protein [Acidimicrobiales bacterium]